MINIYVVSIQNCEYETFEDLFDKIVEDKFYTKLVNQGYRRRLKIAFFTFNELESEVIELFEGICRISGNCIIIEGDL